MADTYGIVPNPAPMAKYPQPSELYECHLYPGRQCRVLTVSNAQVKFQWLGDYSRIEPQVVPVNRFVSDFKLVGAEVLATAGAALDRER